MSISKWMLLFLAVGSFAIAFDQGEEKPGEFDGEPKSVLPVDEE